jgi:hypothetical protein
MNPATILASVPQSPFAHGIKTPAAQKAMASFWRFCGCNTPGCYKIKCWHCRRIFYAKSPFARYCRYRCTNDAFIIRRRKYRAIRTIKRCGHCRKKLTAKRSDALYCGDRCRQREHRAPGTSSATVIRDKQGPGASATTFKRDSGAKSCTTKSHDRIGQRINALTGKRDKRREGSRQIFRSKDVSTFQNR